MPKIIAAGVGLPLIGTGATVTTSQPLLDLSQRWNNVATTFTGMKLNVTDTASTSGSLLLDLQVGGVSQFNISKIGSAVATGNVTAGGFAARIGTTGVIAASSVPIGFSSTTSTTGTLDVLLNRDAPNTLALRNSTAAQSFNIYNTYTDASNYERGVFRWNSNTLEVGTEKAGTGAVRQVGITTDATQRWIFNPAGHFIAATDNTYDIGASGANRPRNIFVAGLGSFANYVAAAGIYPGGSLRSYINSGSDGTISLSNNAGTNSVQLTIGASNLLTLNGGLKTTGATFALQTATTLTDNAAAQVATMTNGPAAGNPTKWIAINDNGVTRYIPAW